MEDNNFYQYSGQYYQETLYDENGKPISPRKARGQLKVITVLLFLASIVMLIILFVILRSHGKMYDRCSIEVVGVVVDNVKHGDSPDSVVFPVFRYEYKGRTYTQESASGDHPAQYSIGDHRTIHINPNDPNEYYTDKDDSTAIKALLLLSGACAVLGVMLVIVIVKSKKNERNMNKGE